MGPGTVDAHRDNTNRSRSIDVQTTVSWPYARKQMLPQIEETPSTVKDANSLLTLKSLKHEPMLQQQEF